ncbi:hypothetical protein [Dactylosporangium sp. CA-139066]|uniref:hypothetical protein n=1 Tax=Dactylosporangium sp. CA-139066 TaxID=3239930 RepID=UPI003D8FF570
MTFDELCAAMQRIEDAVTCAEIEREEARRTVLVPGPASAVKLEAWLAAHRLDDVITVQCSPLLPPDTWYVIDERAIDAALAEAVQQDMRRPLFEVKTNACCGQIAGHGHLPGCMIGNYAWAAATVRSPNLWLKVTGT